MDDYPRQLRNCLASLSPRDVAHPKVVVLTPGIHNSAYFEHSYLAQLMGAELVEGSDLVVDGNDCVHIRTIEGLVRVDVIYRRIEFLRLGNHLERAEMTTRIIDVRSRIGSGDAFEPFEPIQWRGVLRSLYALQSYQASMQAPVEGPAVLEFLFKNDEQPRSYASCVQSLKFGLRRLPRSEGPSRVCDAMIHFVHNAAVRDLAGDVLHGFVDGCQVQLGNLHDEIARTYFHYMPSVPGKARLRGPQGH